MADAKRFLLRLNPALFDALRRWANDDLRSINAQIEYLLTDQARRAGRISPPVNPALTDSTHSADTGDSRDSDARALHPDPIGRRRPHTDASEY